MGGRIRHRFPACRRRQLKGCLEAARLKAWECTLACCVTSTGMQFQNAGNITKPHVLNQSILHMVPTGLHHSPPPFCARELGDRELATWKIYIYRKLSNVSALPLSRSLWAERRRRTREAPSTVMHMGDEPAFSYIPEISKDSDVKCVDSMS